MVANSSRHGGGERGVQSPGPCEPPWSCESGPHCLNRAYALSIPGSHCGSRTTYPSFCVSTVWLRVALLCESEELILVCGQRAHSLFWSGSLRSRGCW